MRPAAGSRRERPHRRHLPRRPGPHRGPGTTPGSVGVRWGTLGRAGRAGVPWLTALCDRRGDESTAVVCVRRRRLPGSRRRRRRAVGRRPGPGVTPAVFLLGAEDGPCRGRSPSHEAVVGLNEWRGVRGSRRVGRFVRLVFFLGAGAQRLVLCGVRLGRRSTRAGRSPGPGLRGWRDARRRRCRLGFRSCRGDDPCGGRSSGHRGWGRLGFRHPRSTSKPTHG